MKTALCLGAGGFIGSHIVKRLKDEGYWVRGVDLKYPEFSESPADEFRIGDLRNQIFCELICKPYKGGGFDLVIQLAADMGGSQYIFTGEHDADVMHNSAMINLNILDSLRRSNFKGTIFYSSSACIYPEYNQTDPANPKCSEDSAYPAQPDSEYGWEKLFSERLYKSYERNYGFDVRIARFHNIFGEDGVYNGGKEKAPAAVCRKVAEVKNGTGTIEIFGDGEQTRSFLYIDECIEGVMRLVASGHSEPINIGSDEMITINDLARMVEKISGKSIWVRNVPSEATGVRGRNSDNILIKEILGWSPSQKLEVGMRRLYGWVQSQISK